MPSRPPSWCVRVLAMLYGVLILKVVVNVASNYSDYFPPNFSSEFLLGRERHFFGVYQWAFYAHILSGPISLILSLVLVMERPRLRFPQCHRILGRIQVVTVLGIVTPIGLAMAWRASAGPIAGVGLAASAIVAAVCVALGMRAALMRRFADHPRWMLRCACVLGSAVVIRLIGGLATVTEANSLWIDTAAAWISWLAPLGAFEIIERTSSARAKSIPRLLRRVVLQEKSRSAG